MYANGYRQREMLGLSAKERMLTRNAIVEEAGTGGIGLLVCALALLLAPKWAGMATFAFLLIAGWKTYMGSRSGKAARMC